MVETIRAICREDVPAVADMFARVFLKLPAAPGFELASYFDDVLFQGTPPGAQSRSRVFVDAEGDVRGFIGVWPRRMLIDGRTIEAAAAGSLMVDQPERHPTAGARLLRSFLSGPQDLSFSETANQLSQRMWEKVGGERLPASSLDWARILRPAGFAVAAAAHSCPSLRVLRPVASCADRIIEATGLNRMLALADATTSGFREEDATTSEIAELIPMLSQAYQLRPDWQSPSLPLLLSHAELKERYGLLHRRILYSRAGAPVACYLYYGRPGATARVLQVLALPQAAGAALDSLFRHAAEIGCVSVHGRGDPLLFDALLTRRCLFYHGAAMVVHARDKALLAEVRRSRALMTGLAGESWNRLIGGQFA